MDTAAILDIASRFDVGAAPQNVSRLHAGHINESYIVEYGAAGRFLLQRINTAIFPQPRCVVENIARVTAHLSRRLGGAGAPRLVPARDGNPLLEDASAGAWRMYNYIEGTRCRLSVETPRQAHQVARAFGAFQAALADLPPPRLHETLPGFHDTPRRVETLQSAIAADVAGRVRDVRPRIDFALERVTLAAVLMELQHSGAVPERIVHNDAKISNVLFDAATDEPLCIVDLDTVMPGLSLFDFGDMVRSMGGLAAEDEPDASKVTIDPALVAALARGYIDAAGGFLTPIEREHLIDAGKVIIYEQAVRFLTDYLSGDAYYRVSRPNHNLDRARAQFSLLRSLEAAESGLRQEISGIR